LLDCLRNHGPETQDGETEEQRPDDGDRRGRAAEVVRYPIPS
jgi:hypothetical protein